MLKQASANGHKTTAHVIGIAASMASAIACACDELKIDANAFLMVHNPWTMALGNAGDLRKEAEVLDQYRDALLAIYRSKFDCSDEVIKKMLDDETWIVGESAPFFSLAAEVIPTQEPLRAAAFAKEMPKFMHTPKALKEILMKKEQEMKEQADLTTDAQSEMENTQENIVEQPTEEVEKTEEVVAENAEAEKPVDEKPVGDESASVQEQPVEEEMVAKAEVDKRVSGM